MAVDTIFTVKNEHLGRLSPDEAILFMAKLLWAEARRLGIPITSVNISSRTSVPDGGVDASVVADVLSNGGLIRSGRTVYQVKTGDFKAWRSSTIHNELFGSGNPASAEFLGTPVKNCIEAGGTYVLVCTGIDFNDEQRPKATEILKECFNGCGYANTHVDVFSQNQLVGLLGPFPSLSMVLNGLGTGRFETFRRWADHDQMRMAFKSGEAQTAFMAGLAEKLREHSEATHVHVRGEAGVGKTRLVLEALRADDLAPLVVYCDGPSKIRESELLYAILKDDNPFSVALVVDECDVDTRSMLWDKLKHCGPRIKLVTIFSEFDEATGNTSYITAPALDDDLIIQILKEYLPAAESAQRWAEYCSGSPRVAHVVGLNLKTNPEDLLKSPDTVNVWDRFIVGADRGDSPRVRQRRIVLQRLALFKRFGFGSAVVEESRAIAALVAQEDPDITWPRFEEIIHELRARKILQGEFTLYITPKLLHIKLWVDWWDVHGNSFVFEDFAKTVPPRLLDWFSEMTRYAKESEAAQRVFKTLLDESGPFQQSGLLTDARGARFFLALTEASPREALQLLKRTVGVWDKNKLNQFTTGRRDVVWALERIAVWRELFPDAARVLLRLAEAENETWSNNATGVFAELFSPGRGEVAPTEAPPEERFPVLKEALEHPSKDCRKVALKACDRALETNHFSRMVGAEYQGLKRQPQLWMPKTWGELFDAYRRVWNFLRARLDSMPDDERSQALDVMLSQTRGLAQIQNLTSMVTDTISELLGKPYVNRKKIIQVVGSVLRYDAAGYPPEMQESWEALQRSLVSDDFSSLMQRFVGMDLLEDHFDEAHKPADKSGPHIVALAEKAYKDPELLKRELPWLVTEEAKNGYRFGYSLGGIDTGASLMPLLLNAQRGAMGKPSVFFLGGYMRALFERDLEAWEKQMEVTAADPALRVFFPALSMYGGMTDKVAGRILSLAQQGIVAPSALGFFSGGGIVRKLSEERFHEWIEFLISVNTREAASCALDLYFFYYRMGEPNAALPRELSLKLLTCKSLFSVSGTARGSQLDDYSWAQLATEFIKQFPDDALDLADAMLEHFEEEGTIIGGFHSEANEVLQLILRKSPEEVWKKICRYLGPPIDTRAFRLKHWLRDGALSEIPAEHVWKWVDEKPDERAWYLASFVNPIFPGPEMRVSAHEILVRYGSRDDVRNNLSANFSTESWRGPESKHYEGKLDLLRAWKKDESNPHALLWIEENISSTEHRAERARILEERED